MQPLTSRQEQNAISAMLGPTRSGPLSSCNFTIGAEASNIINVAVQLVDGLGADLSERAWVMYYLSSDANGDTPRSDPGTVAIGTDGTILVEFTDDVIGLVLSEADGDIDINITHSGTDTMYLNILLPNGKKKTTSAITFA